MIEEYVLVPDVFDSAAYSNPDRIEMCLPHIKRALYDEAIIRDLGDGAWSRYCLANSGHLHRLAKEILKKLSSQNRLHAFPRQSSNELIAPEDWCREALKGHDASPLSGIIAADQTKRQFSNNSVASIEKISSCSWWKTGPHSLQLDRKTDDYLRALGRILGCANSLMFIDPNLDPSARNYSEFHRLLTPLGSRRPTPLIELHRSFCLGDGPSRKLPKEPEWRDRFAPLGNKLEESGLSAEVFFWQDFHDRYLITNLIGFVSGAGFDVTAKQNDISTWANLESKDREGIQRLFDHDAHVDRLKYHFRIGQT